ncbi:MAG: hypothetical protein ACE5MG_12560 [Candidatus Methylomirabilales bacterium]
MEFERLAEPVHLKEEVLELVSKYPEFREEGSHAVADPISYWYGNKLPRYLWKGGWGPRLREIGVSEDQFMQTIGAHRIGFFRWIDHEMEWEKFLDFMILSATKLVEGQAAEAEA